MYGKSNMETYITICKIDSQREFAVWLRKLKQGSVSTQRGGMGKEMGGKFKMDFPSIIQNDNNSKQSKSHNKL